MAINGSNLGINVSVVLEDSATIQKKLQGVLNQIKLTAKIDDIEFDKQAIESKIQPLLKSLSSLGTELKQSFSGIPLTELQQALSLTEKLTTQASKIKLTQNGSGDPTKYVEEYKKGIGNIEKIISDKPNGNVVNKTIEIDNGKVEQTKAKIQSLFDVIKNNNFAKDSDINSFAEKINSINTETSQKEVNDLIKQIKEYQVQLKEAESLQNQLDKIAKAQPDISNKIGALQSNGILNQSDLSDVTSKASNIKTSQDLEAVNSQLSALKTKEGNILSVSKALEKLSADADLLKTKYKGLVPDSEFIKFKSEINSTTAELKKMEGTNFNGLKNQVNELRKTFDNLQNTAKSSGVQLANQDSRSLLGYLTGSALKFSAWLGIGNVVMSMVNGFKDGVGYVKAMDDAMTNIQMITSKSKEEVQGLKQEYSELAGQLHTTNSEIMSGAEELLRAGKTSEETKKMLTASSVGSAISGQSTANVSEELVAISNGFKINADDIMHVIDVISQLDNTSSTSFQEVATAMKYTSASAQGVGVSFENLASYIATVSSISRKSASSIGESFKTIFSRFEDVKGGKKFDPDNEPLSNVERDLNKVGIAIRKDKDTFKDFNTVLDELSKKWATMTDVEKSTVTKALAGTRQRENLLILMDNYKQLQELQKGVANADGNAMQKFEDVKANSLDAKINDLKHSFETLYDSMMNSDAFKQILENITTMFNNLSKSESLKYLANQIANIITWLTKLDSVSITTGLALVGSFKLMTSAFKSFQLAMKAESILQVSGVLQKMFFVMGNGGSALGALKVGFLALTSGIKETIAASLAFIATPIGAVLTALSVVIGVATYAYSKHQQQQAELKQRTDELASSYKNLKQVVEDFNNGKVDSSSVSESLKTYDGYVAKQKELDGLLAKEEERRKRLETLQKQEVSSEDTYGGMGTNVREQQSLVKQGKELKEQIKKVNLELQAQKQAMKNAGIDEYTIQQAKLIDTESQRVEALKKSIQVEMDDTTKVKQHKEEYDNYLSTLKSAYSEYMSLSSAENLSASQKQRLATLVNTLTTNVSGLSVKIGEDGVVRIENNGLIQKQIDMFGQEGVSLNTLTAIRLANAKASAEIQIGETKVTYEQAQAQISIMEAKAQAMAGAIQAVQKDFTPFVGKMDPQIQSMVDSAQAQLKAYQDEITALQTAKSAVDAVYANSPQSTIPTPSTDTGWTPNGSDSGSGANGGSGSDSAAKQDVQNIEDKIDRYLNLNAVLDDINTALSKNKTLQDQANDRDRLNLINQEINLLNQKRNALNNLLAEQQREKGELESQLRDNGFIVDVATGLISNYQSQMQALQNNANALTGDAKKTAIDSVKKTEEAVKTYMDLVHKTMATTQNDILSISGEIKKIYEDELSVISDVESKITEVVKKQVEERKQAYEDEKVAKIKEIEEAAEAYNKANTTNDYQQNLINEQQKLSEIQSQIADASRDQSVQGKARLKSLMDEAKAQQDVIDKMVLDRQRELNNQAFEDQKKAIEDDAAAKTKALDDNYTDQKVSEIVKQALNTGYFQDINGQMVSIRDAYVDFENRFGQGMSELGNKIKNDFISKLDEARQVISSLGGIMNSLGISNIGDVNSGIFNSASNLLSNVSLNLPQITPNLTIPIPNVSSSTSSQTPQIVFNEPFMVIQGNVDEATMPKLQTAINDAIEKFKQSLTGQLQLQGIY